ncbi:MAG: hypothetical protein H0T73_10385 [Ardenticatenales bacterium]|nr:hypothetical protein [Ardenticatenales bacterium]
MRVWPDSDLFALLILPLLLMVMLGWGWLVWRNLIQEAARMSREPLSAEQIRALREVLRDPTMSDDEIRALSAGRAAPTKNPHDSP